MEDFNSKYTGEQVEALLDIVAEGGSGGGGEGEVQKTTEAEITAMGFTKNLGTITEVKMNGVSKGTSGVVDLGDVQTPIADLATIREGASKGATAVQPSSLATVATSGSYNDLSNRPTIPAAVTESTVSGWGFTKNTGTYNKPSGGIPKSDLASAVQASLGKADTALQSYTEQYKGTVTGVKLNGTTYSPSNGVVDLGTISGGDGGGNSAYPIVEIDIEPNASQTVTLQPNTYYILRGMGFTGSGDVTIELAPPENTAIANEYVCLFEYWDGLPVIMPFVVWANGEAPVINSITEISIVGEYGVWCIYE